MNAVTLPQLPAAAYTPLGSEVYRGLTARPRTLSPWLFYDQEGSRLFEQITELDEYYVTRTERGIFQANADTIIAAASAPTPHGVERELTVVELGAGTATKTGLLLQAAVRRQQTVTYCALDVSESALREARHNLTSAIPGVVFESRVADYTEGLGDLPADGTRRLVLYIGSNLGNFELAQGRELLRDIRKQLTPGDMLLLGVDLVKDIPTLVAAYDDARGITAAFNRNVLARINRELGADFDLTKFRHKVRWNGEHARIEMHLESLVAHEVSIGSLDLSLAIRRGETIHTENSYKFTIDGARNLLAQTGFSVVENWTDSQKWFGVFLARVQ
ncbi:MAG TPA: L-histidine N(alpha)-methyltransferase [Acidobacteriaceae bacterium]